MALRALATHTDAERQRATQCPIIYPTERSSNPFFSHTGYSDLDPHSSSVADPSAAQRISGMCLPAGAETPHQTNQRAGSGGGVDPFAGRPVGMEVDQSGATEEEEGGSTEPYRSTDPGFDTTAGMGMSYPFPTSTSATIAAFEITSSSAVPALETEMGDLVADWVDTGSGTRAILLDKRANRGTAKDGHVEQDVFPTSSQEVPLAMSYPIKNKEGGAVSTGPFGGPELQPIVPVPTRVTRSRVHLQDQIHTQARIPPLQPVLNSTNRPPAASSATAPPGPVDPGQALKTDRLKVGSARSGVPTRGHKRKLSGAVGAGMGHPEYGTTTAAVAGDVEEQSKGLAAKRGRTRSVPGPAVANVGPRVPIEVDPNDRDGTPRAEDAGSLAARGATALDGRHPAVAIGGVGRSGSGGAVSAEGTSGLSSSVGNVGVELGVTGVQKPRAEVAPARTVAPLRSRPAPSWWVSHSTSNMAGIVAEMRTDMALQPEPSSECSDYTSEPFEPVPIPDPRQYRPTRPYVPYQPVLIPSPTKIPNPTPPKRKRAKRTELLDMMEMEMRVDQNQIVPLHVMDSMQGRNSIIAEVQSSSLTDLNEDDEEDENEREVATEDEQEDATASDGSKESDEEDSDDTEDARTPQQYEDGTALIPRHATNAECDAAGAARTAAMQEFTPVQAIAKKRATARAGGDSGAVDMIALQCEPEVKAASEECRDAITEARWSRMAQDRIESTAVGHHTNIISMRNLPPAPNASVRHEDGDFEVIEPSEGPAAPIVEDASDDGDDASEDDCEGRSRDDDDTDRDSQSGTVSETESICTKHGEGCKRHCTTWQERFDAAELKKVDDAALGVTEWKPWCGPPLNAYDEDGDPGFDPRDNMHLWHNRTKKEPTKRDLMLMQPSSALFEWQEGSQTRGFLQGLDTKRDIRKFTQMNDVFDASVKGEALKWIVVDRLGEGTFSSVYKAIDLAMCETQVAHGFKGNPLSRWDEYADHRMIRSTNARILKKAETLIKSGKIPCVAIKRIYVTSSPARIRNELELMEDMRGARNVSELLTAFRQQDQVYAVMPFHANDDFRLFYKRLDPPNIRSYMRCLLRALKDAHRRGIVHRDVKPANYLYDYASGQGYLCDFGLAERYRPPSKTYCHHGFATTEKPHGVHAKTNAIKVTERAVQMARTRAESGVVGFPLHDRRPETKANRAGTRGFRAPEVLLKCPDQTVAIDIWASGIILLSILCHKFPLFQSNDDMEALLELTEVFGKLGMERCAALHNRTFMTNFPPVAAQPRLLDMILVVNPRLYDPPAPFCTAEEARTHIESIDSMLDLVKHMLRLDLTKRYTAHECLMHEFLQTGLRDEEREKDEKIWPRGEGRCADLHMVTKSGLSHTVILDNGDELGIGWSQGIAYGDEACYYHDGTLRPSVDWGDESSQDEEE